MRCGGWSVCLGGMPGEWLVGLIIVSWNSPILCLLQLYTLEFG